MTDLIDRHKLPQIPGNKIPKFKQYLSAVGIQGTYIRRPTALLIPIQSQFNQEKVDSLINSSQTTPIIVTVDRHILDGHHRWIASKQQGQRAIDTLTCDCPLSTLIKLGHDFDHSYIKSIHELTTYTRSVLQKVNEIRLRSYICAEINQFLEKEEQEDDLTYDDGSGERQKYSNQDGVSGGMGAMMS